MKNVWLIQWGYYSCSGDELEVICSTHEKALEFVNKEILRRDLKQYKTRVGNSIDLWTDKDYWVSIEKAYIDSPSWRLSEEEYNGM